jgi:hypothetical protein
VELHTRPGAQSEPSIWVWTRQLHRRDTVYDQMFIDAEYIAFGLEPNLPFAQCHNDIMFAISGGL